MIFIKGNRLYNNDNQNKFNLTFFNMNIIKRNINIDENEPIKSKYYLLKTT